MECHRLGENHRRGLDVRRQHEYISGGVPGPGIARRWQHTAATADSGSLDVSPHARAIRSVGRADQSQLGIRVLAVEPGPGAGEDALALAGLHDAEGEDQVGAAPDSQLLAYFPDVDA